MKTIKEKILITDDTEYLVVADNLLIIETSPEINKFADSNIEVTQGEDIRLTFPELIGAEDYLNNILLGQQKSLELKGIARSEEPSPFYIDLYITNFEGLLIVLLIDSTERMVLKQKLLQQNYENIILLSKTQTALSALYESEQRFQIFMNNSPAVAFIKDYKGRYVYINAAYERKFNLKSVDLYMKTDFDFLPEETATQVSKNDYHVISTGQTLQLFETVPTPDGYLRHWLVFKFPCFGSKGERLVGGVAVEVTEQKLLEQQLFEEKELAQVTLKSIRDAVITTDAYGKVKYLNPAAENLIGWSFSFAQGKPIAKVFQVVNESTREVVQNPVEEILIHNTDVREEYSLITHSGKEISIDYSVEPIHAQNGQFVGAVIVLKDVTDERILAKQLSWQATHDDLTQLFNRTEFERCLELALNTRTEKQQHALLFLDLDRFKIVNDTCGHIAGDELLRQISILFQDSIRCSDILARLGGDEFGILLKDCPKQSALKIAETILRRVQEFRFVWQDKTFNIGVSIGLAPIKANTTITNLLNVADTACYVAKNKGRDCIHVYQDEQVKVENGMHWITQINQALENNRFSLYYQPIVSTSNNKSYINHTDTYENTHFEVLLRLIDHKGKEVLPMAFIPTAERYNLMPAIDRWVISRVFTNLAAYKKEELSHCHSKDDCGCIYAINLSGASLNDEYFVEYVRDQLILHQIPPQAICFEITETVAVANFIKATNFIRALKELGCRFALDDFASSISSWNYIKNMSIDYLKIDGSFIKHIVKDKMNMAMVEAINKISHLIGIETIAKYVENQEILDTIKLIGVDYIQGYSIAKPHPLFVG
ncbi:diguanylate cyclase/phosphodiesterase with PAS/PAC and GAF sensor(s) [Calothrix sp. NIES-4071]|nr:diguanylate cyclase/phosphodiesterase with PAS/PAC and GAF sensor(s) [Calothrix sp. NIES-4071]BAZ55439.1 diguanylate cyclase/phosphodiesterase with PAS/PAC and GAF sensor(s) [Calothrix sp. NIES-4105]